MRGWAVLLPLAMLAGCKTVGPDFSPPQGAAGDGYAAPANAARSAPLARIGVSPERDWWRSFGSAELDALVTRALAGNQSLAASIATLEKARARIALVTARQQPQVDAHAQLSHQQINMTAFGFDASTFGVAIDNPEFTLYSAGLGVSYDLDLWGGLKRGREQAVAELETRQYEAEAARLAIAARTVLQAMSIAALNDRIATLQALVDEDRRNLRLTEAKRRAGEGTLVEVLSAEGQLAADQAALPQLEQMRAEGRNMLAVLLGISPAELGATDFTLAAFRLPGEVPVSLPSELAHGRPDVMAAEARLHAATAAIGMAEARFYPDITLGASFQQSANHPEDLFKGAATGFDLLAGLTAPIFHGGALKAEKHGAEAEARAAAARYRQTLLEAFGQVSDLLSALDNDARTVSLRGQSANIADRSLALSRRSFQVGNSGILQVLDASRAAQQAKLGLLDARAQQLLNVARLYAATARSLPEVQAN